MDNNDWRIRWQEDYLKGKTFYFHEYDSWSEQCDHEHCEFCWKKIGQEQDMCHEGYSTLDDYYWVCANCFQDFKDYFSFQIWDEKKFDNKDILDVARNEIGKLHDSEDIYQLTRIINLLCKPIQIKPEKIHISIIPMFIEISPIRGRKDSIIYIDKKKIDICNVSKIKLVEILINIKDCLEKQRPNNDYSPKIYVQLEEL